MTTRVLLGLLRSTGLRQVAALKVNTTLNLNPVTPPPPDVPVGPSSGWTGAPGTGGSQPTQNTRVNAQCIGNWMTPAYQRLNSGVFTVIVKAEDCDLGVTFSGDCVTTTVTTPALYSVTYGSGIPVHIYGYKIDLDVDAFVLAHPTGTGARIWANIQSSDPNMCNRVIGVGGTIGTTPYKLDPPFIFFPQAVSNNSAANGIFTATFSLGGVAADYSSLTLARNAAQNAIVAGKTAAILTCLETGFYVAVDDSIGNISPARGYVTITHAPGIVCTIGRTSLPTLVNNPAVWNWNTGISGVEWRGPGIVFDNAYLSSTATNLNYGRPDWFNGCGWIDSLGRDRVSWNGMPQPGRGPVSYASTTNLPSYFTGCTYSDGSSPLVFGPHLMEIGNRSSTTVGDLHSGTFVVHTAYDVNNSAVYFQTPHTAMTLSYSGPGTATISKAGANGDTGGAVYFEAIVNGVTTRVYPEFYPNLANPATFHVYSQAQLVTAFTTLGFTVTGLGTDAIQARFVGHGTDSSGGAFGPFTVTTGTALTWIVDVHGDWYQAGVVSNVIIANCVLTGALCSFTSILFGVAKDCLVENNFFNGTQAHQSGPSEQHYIFRCNAYGPSASPGLEMDAAWNDVYSQLKNSVVNTVYASGTPNGPTITYNFSGGVGFTGSNASNNQTVASYNAQFVDIATDDFRPAPASTIGTSLVPRLAGCPYDILGNLRGPTDCAGPIKGGLSSKPTFPMAS